MPDVRGQSEDDARTALEDLGFTVEVADVPTLDPSQDGVVQSTDPPQGKTVNQGSTVTMSVGRLGP